MTPFPRNDAFLPPLDGFDERFQEVERTRHQRSQPFDPRVPTLQRKVLAEATTMSVLGLDRSLARGTVKGLCRRARSQRGAHDLPDGRKRDALSLTRSIRAEVR